MCQRDAIRIKVFYFFMRIALYEPDIPQNSGNIFRLGACLGIDIDIIEPTGYVFDDKRFKRSSMDYITHIKYKRHLDWKAFYKWSKNNDFRLMGFGHRVYKNYDPRASVIKKAAENVLNELNLKDPLLDIAKNLEEIALNDDYFIEKRLYPNVDFYSGIIYRAMGIPTNMFTVMFALGRLPGWLAHWREMILNSRSKINRPRQIYTGNTKKG